MGKGKNAGKRINSFPQIMNLSSADVLNLKESTILFLTERAKEKYYDLPNILYVILQIL